MKPFKQSYFQNEWLNHTKYPDWGWLRAVDGDNKSGHCVLCCRTFQLLQLGIGAVKSHHKGKNHMQKYNSGKINGTTIGDFIAMKPTTSKTQQIEKNANISDTNSNTKAPDEIPSEPQQVKFKVPLDRDPNITKYTLKPAVLQSEIKFTITAISSHNSNRSMETMARMFPKLFPDSEIAQTYQMGKDRIGYTSTYGVGQTLKDRIKVTVKNAAILSISYDEALNKIVQKNQMDIIFRFWDEKENKTITRYFTSVFLENGEAVTLSEALKEALPPGTLEKLLSISMDGPNVNWATLNLIKKDLQKTPESPQLIEFGSCSIHVLHGAVKTGHSEVNWKVFDFLRSAYHLFNNFPSRKAEYTYLTGSTKFPKKYCTTR